MEEVSPAVRIACIGHSDGAEQLYYCSAYVWLYIHTCAFIVGVLFSTDVACPNRQAQAVVEVLRLRVSVV